MARKVLIISSSPRRGGNSDLLCDRFMEGAREAGLEVEKVFLKDLKINYCTGCNRCYNGEHPCPQRDDAAGVLEKMVAADVIVMATPVYFYTVCGQMKTLLDRLNPLYESEYKFRDIYMLATAADDDAHAIDKAYNGLQGWVDCFEKAELKGYVFGSGIAEPGDAKNHAETLLDAYNLGKSL